MRGEGISGHRVPVVQVLILRDEVRAAACILISLLVLGSEPCCEAEQKRAVPPSYSATLQLLPVPLTPAYKIKN